MTWLDISTAPRDGTEILVVFSTGVMAVRRWHRDLRSKAGGYWVSGNYRFFAEPTHWMPLPDPPVTTTEAERIAAMDGK